MAKRWPSRTLSGLQVMELPAHGVGELSFRLAVHHHKPFSPLLCRVCHMVAIVIEMKRVHFNSVALALRTWPSSTKNSFSPFFGWIGHMFPVEAENRKISRIVPVANLLTIHY